MLTAFQDSYFELIKIFTITSLPALTTLVLCGWLYLTDVKVIALADPDTLPSQHLLVYGLLGTLASTGILELRLQNPDPDELEGCVFWRADRGEREWQKRLAKFW